MKRTLLVVALVLAISTSIIAGTMAMYVVEIDELAEGSVVAKEFVLAGGPGTDSFEAGVEIAPGETVDWEFSVKNYDGNIVSETGMDLDFKVAIAGTEEDNAIAPLVVTVKDNNNDVVTPGENSTYTGTGTGTITFADAFALEPEGQEKTYTVSIEWPWEGTNDIQYAGADFGTSIKVSVTGTQQPTN